MKNSHFGLSACLLALPSLASAQATFTPLLRPGNQLANGDIINGVYSVAPDRFGPGYAAAIRVSPGDRQLIVADPVDVTGSAPSIRFESVPDPIALGLYLQDMAGGRVAWKRWNSPAAMGGTFIDGVRVTGHGVSVAVPGATWWADQTLRFKSNGDVLAVGTIQTTAGVYQDVIYNVTTSQMILRRGDPIAGTGVTFSAGVDDTTTPPSWVTFSPDGDHYIADVIDNGGRRRIIVDGAQAVLLDTPIHNLEPLGPDLLALTQRPEGTISVAPGLTSAIDDEGVWATPVSISAYDPSNIPGSFVRFDELGVRRGILGGMGAPTRTSAGVSPLGVPLLYDGAPAQLGGVIETLAGTVIAGSSPVDLDGDGSIDPGWEAQIYSPRIEFDGRGMAYAVAVIRDVTTGRAETVVGRFEVPLPGTRSCPGTDNSTGYPATLSSLGDVSANANNLTLVGHGLPDGAFGLPLTSRTPGTLPNPGGSAGTLCLGGAIGRMNGSVFAAPPGGSPAIAIDLSALPQAGGTVPVLPGSTWYFQVWYRDVVAGTATSNLTSALSITFD